ncbi:hypothetical protein DIX60_01895 [Streptococcus iniae]|nr:hypothetical protein BKX95_11445 [Streptococcus iniae]RLV28423.1 hypothetical protein DIX60_01895 [Streptococcus iniae]
MTKVDDIFLHYQKERLKLEEQEDELHLNSKKGEQLIDDYFAKLNYVFKSDTEADFEGREYALRKGQMLFAKFEELVENERLRLAKSYDVLEKAYQKEMLSISEDERK